MHEAPAPRRSPLSWRILLAALFAFVLGVPPAPAGLREGFDTFSATGSFEIRDGRYLFHAADGQTYMVLENSVLQNLVSQNGKAANLTADVTNYYEDVFLLPKSFNITEKGKIPEQAAPPAIKVVSAPSDRAKETAKKAERDEKKKEKEEEKEKKKEEREKEKGKSKDPKGKRPDRKDKDKEKEEPKPAEEDHDADPWANWTEGEKTGHKVDPLPVAPEGTPFPEAVCELSVMDGRTSIDLKQGPHSGFQIIVLESQILASLEQALMDHTLTSYPSFKCTGKLTKFGDQNYILLDAYGSASVSASAGGGKKPK